MRLVKIMLPIAMMIYPVATYAQIDDRQPLKMNDGWDLLIDDSNYEYLADQKINQDLNIAEYAKSYYPVDCNDPIRILFLPLIFFADDIDDGENVYCED